MNLLKDTLLTANAFSLWLESHPAEAIVGKTKSSDGCPLASFLSAQGFYDCEVTTENIAGRFQQDFYWLSDLPLLKTENKQLPAWASLFVAIVDEEPSSAVDAKRALKALSEAVEVAELPRRGARANASKLLLTTDKTCGATKNQDLYQQLVCQAA